MIPDPNALMLETLTTKTLYEDWISTGDCESCYEHDKDVEVSTNGYSDGTKTLIVSFAGLKDIRDIKVVQDEIFIKEVQRIWKEGLKRSLLQGIEEVKAATQKPVDILVVGHSMGGVLAEILANRINKDDWKEKYGVGSVRCTTYGAPRHPCKKFPTAHRYVAQGDLIPFMPFNHPKGEGYLFITKKNLSFGPMTLWGLLKTVLKWKRDFKAHKIAAYKAQLGELLNAKDE